MVLVPDPCLLCRLYANHHWDLRRGQIIAGTSTVDPDGHVGQIGGIDKKVVAADAKVPKIFFAPESAGHHKKLKQYDP